MTYNVLDSSLATLPIESIYLDLLQPRKSYDVHGLDELAGSLKEAGMINKPIVEAMSPKAAIEYVDRWPESKVKARYLETINKAEGEVYLLVAGHRRFLAALRAGFPELTCFVRGSGLDILERRTIQVNENTYTPLEMWQQAYATSEMYELARQMDEDYSVGMLAQDLSISTRTANERLRFVGLHKQIQRGVQKGQITYSAAVNVSRIEDKNKQLSAMQYILQHSLDTDRAYDYVTALLKAAGRTGLDVLAQDLLTEVEEGTLDYRTAMALSLLEPDKQHSHAAVIRQRGYSPAQAWKYVEALLSKDDPFVVQKPGRDGGWLTQAPALRENIYDTVRMLEVILRLAHLAESPSFFQNNFVTPDLENTVRAFAADFEKMGITGPYYQGFGGFMSDVHDIKGKRRKRPSKIISRQRRLDELVIESMEMNQANRLGQTPSPYQEQVVWVDINQIEFDIANPRTKYAEMILTEQELIQMRMGQEGAEEERIAALANSIKSCGLLNPLHLKRSGDYYKLEAGNTRLTAIYLLFQRGELPAQFFFTFDESRPLIPSQGEFNATLKVPCFILDDLPEHLRLRLKMDENSQQMPALGERLESLANLYLLHEQEGKHLTYSGFADSIGQPLHLVKRALAFQELHEDVQMLVHQNLLSATAALALTQLGHEDQFLLAVEAVEGFYSANKIKKRAREMLAQTGQASLFEDDIDRELRQGRGAVMGMKARQGLHGIAKRLACHLKPEELSYYLNSRPLLTSIYDLHEVVDDFMRFLDA